MVHDLKNKDNFEKLLEDAGNKLVSVTFYASWCGPSKLLRPKLADLEKAYPDVVFVEVDADKFEDLGQKFEINATPTTIFIKNKELLDHCAGIVKQHIEDRIKQHK